MEEIIKLINAIGQAHITADIIFSFALLLLSFKVDKIFKQHNKQVEMQIQRQEQFYNIINDILKRQNKIILHFLEDNHKGGGYYG